MSYYEYGSSRTPPRAYDPQEPPRDARKEFQAGNRIIATTRLDFSWRRTGLSVPEGAIGTVIRVISTTQVDVRFDCLLDAYAREKGNVLRFEDLPAYGRSYVETLSTLMVDIRRVRKLSPLEELALCADPANDPS